jgi:hypothetical protein
MTVIDIHAAKQNNRIVPSVRETLPSRMRTNSSTAIPCPVSASRREMLADAVVPRIRTTPTTRPMFTMLLPRASPMAISGRPSVAAVTATVSSGLDVANAATVAPITPAGRRSQAARPTRPRTKSSPPTPAERSPSTSRKRSIATGRLRTVGWTICRPGFPARHRHRTRRRSLRRHASHLFHPGMVWSRALLTRATARPRARSSAGQSRHASRRRPSRSRDPGWPGRSSRRA